MAEGSSKGLTHACRVDTPAALSAACAQLWAQFDQPLLIEPFLSGREFTVGLVGTGAGARVLAVGEMVFCEPSGGIYSYEAKGAPGEPGYGYATLQPVDDAEARRAAEIALGAWRILGGRDAGRIDLRSDARGEPQFLEANPLPGLVPDLSDLPLLAGYAGWEYATLLAHIMAGALERAPRSRHAHHASHAGGDPGA
ncbi:MAG TPA: hypothetical protein VHS99_24820 [Chloroflexota bacterium]|nr:hypothetical protein [Chloroflexota bacterium]